MTATSPDMSALEADGDGRVVAFTRSLVTRSRSKRVLAAGIGAGRVAIGVSFISSPVTFLRLMGLDTATASRVTWLARTAGIRDVALGVGALAATVTGRDDAGWLVAGAACDAVDAVVTGAAAREGRIDRVRGGLVAAGAIGSVAAGVAALAMGRAGRANG